MPRKDRDIERYGMRNTAIWSLFFLVLTCAASLTPAADSVCASPAGEEEHSPATIELCLLRGGMIHPLNGEAPFRGDLLIRRGKIAALGIHLDVPPSARVIDLHGLTVLPGLVDACSHFMLTSERRASGNPGYNALDSWDRFDEERMVWALSRGITALVLAPLSREGFSGQGAVVKLLPGASLQERVIKENAAIYLGLGIQGMGRSLARLQSAAGIADRFQAALDYQEALERYEEELKSYEEALSGEKEKPGAEDPVEGPAEDAPSGKEGEKQTKAEDPKAEKPFDQAESKEEGKEKETEGPAKPKRPPYNLESELLLKAVNGEIPVCVETHRASDILQALGWKDRFHFDLILLGCEESHRVLEAIESSETPLILQEIMDPPPRSGGNGFFHRADTLTSLANRAIPFALASPAEKDETRFLRFQAALAVGSGLDAQKSLEAITAVPARIFGVDDRIGTLETGKDADLVVLDGDPLQSDTRVLRVFINGKTVFQIDD
ncbi:MAG: amidohydrolase family protein [Planctomycetes bacterium]|nr:amidohydrolase family protein [Planctomycetota bacterium]